MALPTGPYQGQDLTNYEAGNRFLPRQFYSLNSPPSQIQTNTIGNTGGVTNTNVAQSYMGYPSYEAWLLAQGGGGNGGGNDPVDNTNRGGVNQNLGPTNITDYESEAYGVGPTWAGSWARAKDAYSKLPTPTNLLFKGIRRWKENREIKKEQKRIAEDRTGIGDHDRGTFEGDHPDAPILTPEQGGWHPGVNGGVNGGQTQGQQDTAAAQRDDPGMGGHKKGGRIGYRYGDPVIPEDETEDVFELMRDQNIPISEQVEGDPFQMRIQELMGKGLSWDDAYDIAEMEFQDLFAEAPDSADEGLASIV